MHSSAFNSFTFTLAFGCATCILILASLVGDRWTRQELRNDEHGTILQMQYGNKGVYVRLLVNDTLWSHHFITYERVEKNANFMSTIDPGVTAEYNLYEKNREVTEKANIFTQEATASKVKSEAKTLRELGDSAMGLSVSALILSATWIIALCVANSYYSSFPHFRWLPYCWSVPAVLNLAAAATWSAASDDNHLPSGSLAMLFGSVWGGAVFDEVKTGLSTILGYLAVAGCVFTGHRTALALQIIKERPEPTTASDLQQGQNLA